MCISIYLSSNGLSDKLLWAPAKNGEYTIKAGYLNEKEARRNPNTKASTSCIVQSETWKHMWKLQTVPRVQHFLWGVLTKAVARNEALFSRKRSPTRVCPICEKEEENIEHLFFLCPWTRCVWFGCNLGIKSDNFNNRSFTSWWKSLNSGASKLADHDITLICWILWYIWKQRNESVFNFSNPSPNVVIDLASNSNEEFWTASVDRNLTHMAVDVNENAYRWKFPPQTYLKVSCDGAFIFAAVGIICRDEKGEFKWGFIDKVKSISAFMTESLALKRALMLATDLGHDKIIFETDCDQNLIKSVELRQPEHHDWKCRGTIQDIINLLASKVGFSLSFTPRRGNVAAEALKGVYPLGWVLEPSLSLISVLTCDAKEARDAMMVNQPFNHRTGVG